MSTHTAADAGTETYSSGADMWRDCCQRYGATEARGICNRYLDMQMKNQNEDEHRFCRELYTSMMGG